jgi:hypothetical protein
MALFPLGLLSQGGAAPVSNTSMELISTVVTTGSSASITFSSIPAGYKHLQLRYVMVAASGTPLFLRFNGQAVFSYYRHLLRGNGSAIQSSYVNDDKIELSGNTALGDPTFPLVGVCDILDAFSTVKRKTVKNLYGNRRASVFEVGLNSGGWNNDIAITSVNLSNDTAFYGSGSRFSLYGIKG